MGKDAAIVQIGNEISRPTTAHCFMRLLHEKGLLLRLYSQNIDSLEALAGIPPEKVVATHGNFDGAHCIGEASSLFYTCGIMLCAQMSRVFGVVDFPEVRARLGERSRALASI